ncbi:MAG TPA: ABC transporter substrate-binding protein [Burkholderiales bacterium]|nr:ABC transporter substrate-binding protein [Burkholderiales bacterium]
MAADPIRIGVCGPYVGGSAAMGTSMRNGALIAIDGINGSGGVLGRPLEALVSDDRADVDVANAVAQELVGAGVVASVGFINTDPALSATRHYQAAGIPVIVSCTAGIGIAQQFEGPQYPRNYVFRVSMDDGVIAACIADHVFHRLRLKRPAIFAATAYYGESSRQDLSRRFGELGIPCVAQEAFKLGDRDMRPQLARAAAADADIIVTFGVGPEVAAIVAGMAEIGLRVPVIGSWPIGTSTFIDLAGAQAEGAMAPQTFIEESTTPRRAAFIRSYHERYGVQRIPSAIAAAQTFDAVYLLKSAIEQAQSVAGEALCDALENLERRLDGVVMRYQKPFARGDHEAITTNVPVIGVVRDRRMTFWSEEDRQTAQILRTKDARCRR